MTSVPAGATTGSIVVTTPAGSVTSWAPFSVTASAVPTITGVTPTTGTPGTTVTISGTNFETVSTNDKLRINTTLTTATSATATQLVATVPNAVTSGRVAVATPGGTATGVDFFVPPPPYTVADIGATGRMSFGESRSLTIGTASTIGLMLFDGTQGHRISLNVTTASFSKYISVLNPNGTTLVDRVFMTGGGFIDVTTLPASGTYTILVDGDGDRVGNVTLNLYDVPADVTSSMTAGGPAVTVTTTVPGQNARVTFAGTQGQRISLNETNTTLWRYTSILKPDGSTHVNRVWMLGNGTVDVPALPLSGTYTILIDGDAEHIGSVTLTLTQLTAAAPAIGTVALAGPSGAPGAATDDRPASRADIGAASADAARASSPGHDGAVLGLATAWSDAPAPGSGRPVVPAQRATPTPSPAPTSTPSPATGTATPGPSPGATGTVAASASPSPSATPTPAGQATVAPPSRRPHEPRHSPDPEDEETWVPDTRRNLRGDWRSHRPEVRDREIPSLAAPAGVTALAGQVLTVDGKGLAAVKLGIDDVTAVTDQTGRFLLGPLAAGRTTALPYTIWLPRLDEAHAARLPAGPTAAEVVVRTPRIPGLELHLPPGTVVRDSDGAPAREVSLTAVPVDRPPFPLPAGVEFPVYFTAQPGGSHVLPAGAWLVYPNLTGHAPGTRFDFWNYDPEAKGWHVYGHGTVSPDGTQVVPDPGVKLYELSGAMISVPGLTPPAKGPRCIGEHCTDGDPVDLSTGLFVLKRTDLTLPDVLPLALTRTYRPDDPEARPFGTGTTHPYAMFLWSSQQYQEADLILPDGGRVHYVRTSPGTGFTDAVFEHTATPTPFYKSVIRWNGKGWDLTLRDGTVYVFGENAPLQAIRDRHGNTITLTYSATNGFGNGTGNILQVTSPNGRWLAFSYDGANRITQARDNSGRTVGYSYDASGRLWKVTDPVGGVEEYTYDASHRMLTVKDRRGITFLTNEYDASGRVSRQTMADGGVYLYAYTIDGSGNVSQVDATNPRGVVRRLAFNGDGYPLADTRALGRPEAQTTSSTRQAGTSFVTAVTDPLGRRTEFAYDASGNLVAMTELAGTANAATTAYTYEPSYQQIASVTDPLSHTTTLAYDLTGNLTRITDPRSAAVHSDLTYNPSGQVLTVTSPLGAGHTTQMTYDFGDLVTVTDPLGRPTRQFADSAGRVVAVTDPLGSQTRFEYDGLNRTTRLTNALGGATVYTYDPNGNLRSVTDPRQTAAGSAGTVYTYDTMDRLASYRDPLLHTESFTYDPNGNLTEQVDRRGQVTVHTYDALDRRVVTGYGATGLPGSPTYESTVTTTYDAADRPTQVVDSLRNLSTSVRQFVEEFSASPPHSHSARAD